MPGDSLGQEVSTGDDRDLYATLDELDCAGVSRICQETIPGLFIAGQPDSLADLLAYWESVCGPAEPITRTRILGAIWDGAFDEELYDREIIDFLIWFGDPVRQTNPGDEPDPGLGSGDVASPADFTPVRDRFDAFTRSLADQLLPHTNRQGLEEFFCLFYSGRTSEAWRLLEGEALQDSKLKRYHDWELERISIERTPTNILITTGFWMPSGNLALAGDHFCAGLMAEQRRPAAFLRLAGDILIGRSRYPYTVHKEDYSGRSDRFNAVTVAAEGGVSVWNRGSSCVDLYAGGGMEMLVPFREESLVLVNFKGLLGLGYRLSLGSFRKWFVGCDVRREWMTDRNDAGTPLDGRAWSLRLSFGYNRNHDLDRRLHGLGK